MRFLNWSVIVERCSLSRDFDPVSDFDGLRVMELLQVPIAVAWCYKKFNFAHIKSFVICGMSPNAGRLDAFVGRCTALLQVICSPISNVPT